MEFMGIGPMELLVILIIALIVFGPNRLPEIAAQIGKLVNNMRQAGFELTRQFNRELNKELESSKRDVAVTTEEIKAIASTSNPLADEEKGTQSNMAVATSEHKSDKREERRENKE